MQILVPRAHKIVENHRRNIKFYKVHGAYEHLFGVLEYNTPNRWTIHIDKKSCSCNQWDITSMPCVHGVAILNKIGKQVVGYCSDNHKVSTYLKTYSGFVTPMAPIQQWSFPIEVVLEPKQFRGVGRPKKERIKGYIKKPKGASKLKRKCSYCGSNGHTRRTCGKEAKAGIRPKVQRRKPTGKYANDGSGPSIVAPTTSSAPEGVQRSQTGPSTAFKRTRKL